MVRNMVSSRAQDDQLLCTMTRMDIAFVTVQFDGADNKNRSTEKSQYAKYVKV